MSDSVSGLVTFGPTFEIEAISVLERHGPNGGTYDVRLVGELRGERVRLTSRIPVRDVERFYGPRVAEWMRDTADPSERRDGPVRDR